jgi:hypothetical protein
VRSTAENALFASMLYTGTVMVVLLYPLFHALVV